MTRNKVILIKVKWRNALLRKLLEHICSYPKSVLRYKFLILDSYEPDIVYLRQQALDIFRSQKAARKPKDWGTLHYGEHCTIGNTAL